MYIFIEEGFFFQINLTDGDYDTEILWELTWPTSSTISFFAPTTVSTGAFLMSQPSHDSTCSCCLLLFIFSISYEGTEMNLKHFFEIEIEPYLWNSAETWGYSSLHNISACLVGGILRFLKLSKDARIFTKIITLTSEGFLYNRYNIYENTRHIFLLILYVILYEGFVFFSYLLWGILFLFYLSRYVSCTNCDQVRNCSL